MNDRRRKAYLWRHQNDGTSLKKAAEIMGVSTDRAREMYDEEISRRLHRGANPLE
jgi:hypothetical protein